MNSLDKIDFDAKACEKELADFEKWLSAKKEYSESKEIQPFFKERRHLSAFIGSYNSRVARIDRIKSEFELENKYRPDLTVGDSRNRAYVFVEFEDARENSIFQGGNELNRRWASRFEKGFSQLVDWFWCVNRKMDQFELEGLFGGKIYSSLGLLIIGRDEFFSESVFEKDRFNWRREAVLVSGRPIICVTFDELYRDLDARFRLLRPTIEETIEAPDPDGLPPRI